MKTYAATILQFEEQDKEVRDIVRKFIGECHGSSNDSYVAISFDDDNEDDNWGHGWVTAEDRKTVKDWLIVNGLFVEGEDQPEFLVDYSW